VNKERDESDIERKHRDVSRKIGQKEQRRLKAKKEEKRANVWLGLSMFGLVGWSVTIPTLIGIAIGIWLDSKMNSGVTWTLAGLVVGVAVGSLAAWYWINQEGHGK